MIVSTGRDPMTSFLLYCVFPNVKSRPSDISHLAVTGTLMNQVYNNSHLNSTQTFVGLICKPNLEANFIIIINNTIMDLKT